MRATVIGCGIAHRVFGATVILLQSDCRAVERQLWRNLPEDITRNCRVQYRHVKGHTRREESRYWVNNWCDRRAREHMRSLRT